MKGVNNRLKKIGDKANNKNLKSKFYWAGVDSKGNYLWHFPEGVELSPKQKDDLIFKHIFG